MTERYYLPWENQIDDSFKKHAACRGMDAELFIPSVGTNGKDAKAVCNGTRPKNGHPGSAPCPVREECLQYSLQIPGPVFGIWGGKSERERRNIKRETHTGVAHINTNIKAVSVRRIMRHGTTSGYQMHRQRRETPCDACKEAHAQAARGWRNRDNDHVTIPALQNLVTLIHAENARASRTPDRS